MWFDLENKANDFRCVLGTRRRSLRLECENKLRYPWLLQAHLQIHIHTHTYTYILSLCLRSYSIPSSQPSKKSLSLKGFPYIIEETTVQPEDCFYLSFFLISYICISVNRNMWEANKRTGNISLVGWKALIAKDGLFPSLVKCTKEEKGCEKWSQKAHIDYCWVLHTRWNCFKESHDGGQTPKSVSGVY